MHSPIIRTSFEGKRSVSDLTTEITVHIRPITGLAAVAAALGPPLARRRAVSGRS